MKKTKKIDNAIVCTNKALAEISDIDCSKKKVKTAKELLEEVTMDLPRLRYQATSADKISYRNTQKDVLCDLFLAYDYLCPFLGEYKHCDLALTDIDAALDALLK